MTRSTEKLIHAALRDGCREHCDALIDELRRLHAQRDALLEALKEIDSWLVCSCIATAEDMAQSFPHMQQVASAAIKAVEEGK